MKRYHDHRYSYKEKHLNEVCLPTRGLVHYHHHGKHGNVQVGMMLGKELRLIHRHQESMCHTMHSLNIGYHKVCLHSDTLPPTWPSLLIVPLLMGQAFKHMSLWGLLLFIPPYSIPWPPKTCKYNVTEMYSVQLQKFP